jgi:hypothetical protein
MHPALAPTLGDLNRVGQIRPPLSGLPLLVSGKSWRHVLLFLVIARGGTQMAPRKRGYGLWYFVVIWLREHATAVSYLPSPQSYKPMIAHS